jgi:sugar-specific transcriptional regulator TrmB
MDTDRLHDALTRAGLTEYQAAVYLAVLEMGSGPVVDVAERTDVPGSQVYEVVRTLEDRGFVETIDRDRLHARAMEPVDVLAELRETGQLLTDAAEEIERRWERPDPEQHRVSVVTRRATVIERARDAVADADVAVEIAMTADQFRAIRSTLEAAARRGIVVHVAINGPLDGVDEELDGSAITEVRHSETPGSLLAIVDRTESFVSPNYHHDEEYGVLVDDQILSFMMHWTFLTCGWVPWETVHETADVEATYISIEECVRELAALWHDGAAIEVTVVGSDTDTGEHVELEGELVWMLTDETPPAREPRYEHLGGNVTLVVDTGGGWGAVYEDVEADVVTVDEVSTDEGASERAASRRYS